MYIQFCNFTHFSAVTIMKLFLVVCTVPGTKLPLFVTVTSNACTENHQNPLPLHRVILKGDGKVVPFHAMKAFTRSGGIAPLILNHGTMMVTSHQLHVLASLPQGKNPWHILNGRPPPHPNSWTEHYGEKTDLLPLPGIKPQIFHPPA